MGPAKRLSTIMHLTPDLIKYGALFVASIGVTIALAAKTAYQRRPKETPDVYGSARFMNEKEVRQSGLLVDRQSKTSDGVYIGSWQDRKGKLHYLRDVSNGHVLMCGPTRSGKGISCIMPTLLSWRGCTIINDEKGELYAQTSPWRAQFSQILRWEPAALRGSNAWNPLSEVRLGTPYEIADAQNVALMMIDVRGHGLDRLDHWQMASVPLLAAMILHELYEAHNAHEIFAFQEQCEECSPWVHPDERRPPTRERVACLGDVAQRFGDPSSTADDLFEEMKNNQHIRRGPQWTDAGWTRYFTSYPFVASEGKAQMDRADRERTSITSTMKTFLILFSDPIITANTSESDFDLTAISDGSKPTSIYITTLPNDTVRLRPLVRLFITVAQRSLMTKPLIYHKGQPMNPHRYETLIVGDEFPAWGKLDEVEASLARIASWGVKWLVAVQDLSQLNGIYGIGHSIIANMATRVYFPTNDLATAKTLSESIGITTKQTPHTTIMGKRFGMLSQVTQNIQPTPAPLMRPEDVLIMPAAIKDDTGRVIKPGKVLIFRLGERPLETTQLLYFADPEFAARAHVEA